MGFDAKAELAALESHLEDEKEIALYEADEIALEINVIKRRLAQETILAAVEIGKLLVKAKEKVPHGMWGNWLSENVAYSQSTANNMMRLYKEYGEQEQISFFSENPMEIFGNLSQSQAVALLGLSYEKRKEYVETHDMENTSVREIEVDVAAIKAELEAERDALIVERDKLGEELGATKKKLCEAEAERDDARLEATAAKSGGELANVKKEYEDFKKSQGKAAKEWAKERAELERQLEEARATSEQMTIHEEISEEKRAEIEAQVAAVYEEKLAAARRESDKKIMAAGNPAVIEINLLFGELQEAYARISALLVEVEASAPDMAVKLKAALEAGIKKMAG